MQTKLFLVLLIAGLISSCTNSQSGGMLTTDLGNRYSYLTQNEDGTLPETGDYVYFNLALRNQADSLLNDSRDQGEPLIAEVKSDSTAVGRISPVDDVLRNLREGESALIRYDISEEPNLPPQFANDTVVVYEIEIVEVLKPDAFFSRRQAEEAEREAVRETVRALGPERVAMAQQLQQDYAAGTLDGELQETASGLKYIVHEEGTGQQPAEGDLVVVQYIGMFAESGEIFDQSFERGEGIPFQLGVGRVIPAWDEGIALLKEGSKATFFVPSEIGYGQMGNPPVIGPNSDLIFYVELEEVR